MFKYEKKRSEGGPTACRIADPKRHDWHRGWLMRGLQIRFNENYKPQSKVRLLVSPEIIENHYLYPWSRKEAGKCYKTHVNRAFPLLDDKWEFYYSIRDESDIWKVMLKGNNARGVGIECHYDDILTCSMQQITGRKKAIVRTYRGYGKHYDHSEEYFFPFRVDSRRSDYDGMELKVHNRLCDIIEKMTDAVQPKKRPFDAIE